MKPKTLQVAVKISILVLFVLLVGVLIYSLFYFKEINCNARFEFVKMDNCTQECKTNCIEQGFSIYANHSFIGEKIYVAKNGDIVRKDIMCSCECKGCRD